MIKNVIFDIGNVLVGFDWKDFYKSFGYTDEIVERIADATVRDPFWNEIDRGVMSEEEILEGFIKKDPEIEAEIRETYADYSELLHQFEYTKGLIKDLQNKGFKVYCLSNMSYKAVRECKALDFLPMLDGYVLSCDVKLIKPDNAIYELFLDKYGLNANECVFFDDLQKNIEGAKKAGIHGIVFKDLKSAISDFEALVKKESQKDNESTEAFQSKYSKKQRIGAIVCLSLIALLYLVTIVCMVIKAPWAKDVLKVSLGATFVLPILTWVYIWMIGKLTKKETIADFNFFK